MISLDSTRHNPLVDPTLRVWSWEIPVYLFLGGIVAGLMVLGGLAMLRVARGDDPKRFFSMQAPLLGFVLMNIGMLALLLDLTHRWYVWAIYLTFQWRSPMAWGSWVLLVVYGVLLLSALWRLPQAWPWLCRRVPALARASEGLMARPGRLKLLGGANLVLGVGLGIYTGILLNTMVARPLWNSAILGPLFLASGLSAGAAVLHLAASALHGRPTPQGAVGAAVAAMLQPLGPEPPDRHTVQGLVRADQWFLAAEALCIALLLANLFSSSASHAAAAGLITHGPYATAFWLGVVGIGVALPLLWQALELAHKLPHTIVPALLVLAGGFTLRWVMVGAGQMSHLLPNPLLSASTGGP